MQTLSILRVVATIVAYFLGAQICKQIRMKDHAWKLGVVLACVTFAGFTLYMKEPKYGIDLRGGVILIYEIDEQRSAEMTEVGADGVPMERAMDDSGAPAGYMNDLIQSLARRINPTGTREIVIRPYGANQVEIIVPEASDAEIRIIKDVIKSTGFLQFRIVANRERNPRAWSAGERALESPDPRGRTARFVKDGDEIVGEWVLLGKEELTTAADAPPDYRVDPRGMLQRELVPGQLEVLLTYDPDLKLEGKHLRNARMGNDEQGRPNVEFTTTPDGAALFGSLTGMNLPDKSAGLFAQLGIVMDDVLISAPQIQSRISTDGQITGRFTQEDVDRLVRILRAGKLPAVLQPEPISDNNISPLLGEDTIQKGKLAIGGSLVAVLLFMLVYYRFAGVIACMALGLSLMFLVALMFGMEAAFTLPGLAGIVLTVGMAVDANVLIFERIREELNRGAALRMAIRNGFERATTTIVDANVTTLLTAVILYAIGTDQIKGFGVTLILGILTSMFTAIFCARIVFDIAERKGFIKSLSMSRIIGETSIRFLDKAKIAIGLSTVLIAIGVAGVMGRGKQLLDIDFTGGMSVTCLLNEPLPIDQVRRLVGNIADEVSVTQINPVSKEKGTVYKIDASMDDADEMKSRLVQSLVREDGSSRLVMRSMNATPPVPLSHSTSRSTLKKPGERLWMGGYASLVGLVTNHPQEPQEPVEPVGGDEPTPSSEDQPTATAEVDQEESFPAPAAEVADESTPQPPGESAPQSPTDTATDPPSTNDRDQGMLCTSVITFEEAINSHTLTELVEESATRLGIEPPRMVPFVEGWDGQSEHGFKEWNVKFSTDVEDTAKILDELVHTVNETPVWLSANRIGGKVAGDMRWKAITSILLSMIAIIIYIWIRFQHLAYGLAAVLALVHDVLITVGAVAISYWLAGVAGVLLIDPFKISLPIVAAILTVIGYSLNDTIVIFDRIRDVKGKSPTVTKEIIDTSLNQTLSRTLLTSITTLIVVVILYCFGGEGIHGFAFALTVGVVAGTYSTIFIASPSLLWLSNLLSSKPRSSQHRQPMATTAG